MRPLASLALIAALAFPGPLLAQGAERLPGPVIRSAGGTFAVPEPDIETPLDRAYRIAFEVAVESPSPGAVNPGLNTAARFLNMHARAGVPPERMRVAVVVHGPAGKTLLGNAAYRARTGADNPNLALLDELADAGVRIILCGQTAISRDLPWNELAEPVETALSAMTALLLFQDEGYRVNPF
ncbi:MAG: hypothetical protein GWM92_18510 [Gemmatimonadetes bacterium]|nr:DsrE family protein [Gemmatimonadota bacterium]NIR80792.1 DsrE family protein [Gemmatimonadota bacterium]NIT89612.1 DsrE family protein [Gemmatimonadota bacterium]NIU33392.1 DsrE family protein [Gemmatimonadota bacterium]NIU37684.1 hypothetical protein [Gemmatimonadota bacterium]